jgi:hypothetical protein
MTFAYWQNRPLTDLSREELIEALAWCINALEGGPNQHGIDLGVAYQNHLVRTQHKRSE